METKTNPSLDTVLILGALGFAAWKVGLIGGQPTNNPDGSPTLNPVDAIVRAVLGGGQVVSNSADQFAGLQASASLDVPWVPLPGQNDAITRPIAVTFSFQHQGPGGADRLFQVGIEVQRKQFLIFPRTVVWSTQRIWTFNNDAEWQWYQDTWLVESRLQAGYGLAGFLDLYIYIRTPQGGTIKDWRINDAVLL